VVGLELEKLIHAGFYVYHDFPKFYLSGHDTCDHALDRMMKELDAETQILEAGATYHF
jgi:hypothetical protein